MINQTAGPGLFGDPGVIAGFAVLAGLALLFVIGSALPTVRASTLAYVGEVRRYLFGPDPVAPPSESAEDVAGNAAGAPTAAAADAGLDPPAGSAGPSSRASDRESYDFDLDVFTALFGGEVDTPPPTTDTSDPGPTA